MNTQTFTSTYLNKHKCVPLFFLGLIFCCQFGCYEKVVPRQEGQAVPVRTAKVMKKDVQLYRYFSGTTFTEPIKIVPRVRGYLEAISFVPGDVVEKDAVLFKLEQFDYIYAQEEATAGVAIAEAGAAKAKADYDRELSLKKKGEGFTTQADIDRTKALWDEATAQIALKKAALSEAKKQLERTTIKSPARGKISRNLIEVGNLVDGTGANPPVLATVMSMDPMYVYFQMTDSDFIQAQSRIYSALKAKLGDKYKDIEVLDNKALVEVVRRVQAEDLIKCRMQILGEASGGENGEFPYEGYIDYNDNVIDVATGTNTIRVRFPNPNYRIYPGTLCRVRLEAGFEKGALLVKEKAICTDLSTKYIWVLDEKGTTQKREIVLGEPSGQEDRIVKSGLREGETYILDGTQKVRMGSTITELKEEVVETAKEPSSDNKDAAKPESAPPAGVPGKAPQTPSSSP